MSIKIYGSKMNPQQETTLHLCTNSQEPESQYSPLLGLMLKDRDDFINNKPCDTE